MMRYDHGMINSTAMTAAIRLLAAISLMPGDDGATPDEALTALDFDEAVEQAESDEVREALEALFNLTSLEAPEL